MAKPASDRRRDLRYEIVGRLAGSLEAIETHSILNLSRGGVCVRSARLLPVESTSAARLVWESQSFDFHVRVRHVSEAEADETGDRYLIGLEFIGVSRSTLDEIERAELRERPSHKSTSNEASPQPISLLLG